MEKASPELIEKWEERLAHYGLGQKQLSETRYWNSKPQTSCPEEHCPDCGGGRFKLVESELTEGAYFWKCRQCGSDVAIDVTE